ncbi:hypothetical protein GCM10011383_32230 [Hymenobacter cavernae]|uniref:Secretion system C-terminal sorting domain-containing protein n=1 Tax=Hymenobacter cavernae TaxID=2044852 RepID=A0ABQ1UGS5_9BACT|nr:hypothetical protein GCM10011383_32230 [Hymenobacter cavernae]
MGAGETVCIPAGTTVTGNITWNDADGIICNSGTITNASVNVPTRGTIYNNAVATFENLNLNGPDARIFNYSSLTVNSLNANNNSSLYNGAGATTRAVNLNLNSITINNLGTLILEQGVALNGLLRNGSSASFTAPTVTINSPGRLENLGNFNTNFLTNNALITNCGTINQRIFNVDGFLNNSSGTVNNYGLIDVVGNFRNDGNFQGATQGGGFGAVQVSGFSVNQGSFGTDPTSRLDFCDRTSSNSGRFDDPRGTIGASVTYCQFAASSQLAGCANSPLPIELTSFSAKLGQGGVLLSWATASEKNNNKFVVERSADGRSFEAVLEVPGHGTSTSAHTYSVTDASPLLGTSYYRLRQLDFDGTATYSPVASIQNHAAALVGKLGLHPNPAVDYTMLSLPETDDQRFEVRISTLSGKLVRRTTVKRDEPRLDLRLLPAGTYLIQVQSSTTQLIQRLIKQ